MSLEFDVLDVDGGTRLWIDTDDATLIVDGSDTEFRRLLVDLTHYFDPDVTLPTVTGGEGGDGPETDAGPLRAVRARGFAKYDAESYETEGGGRHVRVTRETRKHSFGRGYVDAGRERVVFEGSVGDARMLLGVLAEVLPDTERSGY